MAEDVGGAALAVHGEARVKCWLEEEKFSIKRRSLMMAFVVITLGVARPSDYVLMCARLISFRYSFRYFGLCQDLPLCRSLLDFGGVRKLSDERFVLWISHPIDHNRALEVCAWSFEKGLLIFSLVGVDEDPMMFNLNWCDFHVHVHDLPLSKMNLG
ncbi:hypothetical protein Salat_2654200 [Sesamum alatum]|uniref:Uncharacterized protein n=1 Tax=Sesamum alatum TaxID=300844 RepID=A0AAE1XQ63_9LAMI|nr:hypothetical protein Salat_2654200 [Sesamum alatum]